MISFPVYFGLLCTWIAIHYMSKWLQVVTSRINDQKVVMGFAIDHVFY